MNPCVTKDIVKSHFEKWGVVIFCDVRTHACGQGWEAGVECKRPTSKERILSVREAICGTLGFKVSWVVYDHVCNGIPPVDSIVFSFKLVKKIHNSLQKKLFYQNWLCFLSGLRQNLIAVSGSVGAVAL